jgi:hypothetical protein
MNGLTEEKTLLLAFGLVVVGASDTSLWIAQRPYYEGYTLPLRTSMITAPGTVGLCASDCPIRGELVLPRYSIVLQRLLPSDPQSFATLLALTHNINDSHLCRRHIPGTYAPGPRRYSHPDATHCQQSHLAGWVQSLVSHRLSTVIAFRSALTNALAQP